MKQIYYFTRLLLFVCCLAACDSEKDLDMTIELECPQLTYKIKDNTVTITWTASAKAAGYAYKVNDQELVKTDKETLVYSAKIDNGAHTFSIYAIGDDIHTRTSATRTLAFEMNYDSTLPSPSPSVTTENDGITTVQWKAIPRAIGYAYKIDDAPEFTKVGAETLTFSAKLKNGPHSLSLYAIGDGIDTKDSPAKEVTFDVRDTSIGVFLKKENGQIIDLPEISSKIYAATIPCSKKELFTILINNVEYGFLAYSGNGGIGTVNSVYATVPFYNQWNYSTQKAIGQMSSKPIEGESTLNKLYTNLAADANVYLKIDCGNTDGVPRYHLQLEQTPDENIIIEQNFDLCVWGGDWMNGNSGEGSGFSPAANVAIVDGTEPATPKSISYATAGTSEASTKPGETTANPIFLRNRDLMGWSYVGAVEHPGYMHVSIGNTYGKLLTPPFGTLSGVTSVTAEIDIARFSATGSIRFAVTGGGTIQSCTYTKDGAANETTATVSGTDSEFLFTPDMSNNYNAGTDKTGPKKWSHFKFVLQNVTAKTRIGIDSTKSKEKVNDQRICVDNIIVRKVK